MKKYVLSAFLIMATFMGISAQQYSWWAGGRTTLWASDDKTTVIVAPEIGYNLNEYFTVAASVGLHSNRHKLGSDWINSEGVVLNPYFRFNAFKKGVLFGFIDSGIEFGLGDFEGVQVGFKPGIAVAITDRFVVALQYGFIGYSDGKGIDWGLRNKGVGADLSGYQSGLAFFYCF